MAHNNLYFQFSSKRIPHSIKIKRKKKKTDDVEIETEMKVLVGGNIHEQKMYGSDNPERKKTVVTNKTKLRKAKTDRTTRLLIVILTLFLISEFPQVYFA